MGMPITVEVVDSAVTDQDIDDVFTYFEYVDEKFSTYKATSEITRINQNKLALHQASREMKEIFALAERTRQETDGYFDIARNGQYDPSGIVKGWAIYNAALILQRKGFDDFYMDAGGDIQAFGKNTEGQKWRIGIRNPFNMDEIVKVVAVSNGGVATSGNYIRGQHIYNPKSSDETTLDIVSLTVIGPNIYEADRFATAAFAMGADGIYFIESLEGFEGYMIDKNGLATLTSGFEAYVCND
jgi:thiamine biosynthesis lipoprotein